MIKQIEAMRARELSRDDQLRFAHAAIGLRWPHKSELPLDAHSRLTARFPSQNQPDVWSVLNRIQDNTLNGFAYYDAQLQRDRHVRRITGIPRDVALHQALWKEAVTLTS